MLAREIAHLAGLRLARVASWAVAAAVRIEVASSCHAATVGWNGVLVDVVHCSKQLANLIIVNRERESLRKGPPTCGRPLMLIVKRAPVLLVGVSTAISATTACKREWLVEVVHNSI